MTLKEQPEALELTASPPGGQVAASAASAAAATAASGSKIRHYFVDGKVKRPTL